METFGRQSRGFADDMSRRAMMTSAGVGGLSFRFDHLQELTGKQADQVVAARKAAE